MYKLREAGIDDFEEIAAINDRKANVHIAVIENEMEKDTFEHLLEQNVNRLYVVEKSGEILAFTSVRIDSESHVIYINKLSIVREYERKGLDEHLYRKVERLAERIGVIKLFVKLTTENESVHDFFKRKGWKLENGAYVLNRL